MLTSFHPPQIRVFESPKVKLPLSVTSTRGNASVLDVLFPQLKEQHISSAKPFRHLEQVDHYMLEELSQISQRIGEYCRLTDTFSAQIITCNTHKRGLSQDCIENEIEELNQLIEQDAWLQGALAWIQPNLIALAHSVEMQEFSYAYEICKQRAVKRFSHLRSSELQMQVSLKIRAGRIDLILETPATIFGVCVA